MTSVYFNKYLDSNGNILGTELVIPIEDTSKFSNLVTPGYSGSWSKREEIKMRIYWKFV